MLRYILVLCICVGTAYAQTDVSEYTIHIPDMMIRGESYGGVVIHAEPAHTDRVFRLASTSGDIIIPDSVVLRAGANHAIFDIYPAESTILAGIVQTTITVIPPDGNIQHIEVETHPGVGVVSRLWMVGPGADGADCSTPDTTTAESIVGRAAEGVFDVPEPENTIRTRLHMTTIHVFLTDRYCTPSVAPAGGVAITMTSDSPDVTFGSGRTHITGIIPQGFNSAVLDVYMQDGSQGTLYGSGVGVISDAIQVVNEPDGVKVRLGIGPSIAMESSYVTYNVWLEQGGEQYVPDKPMSVYLVTDNPVLASFDQTLVDSTGPAFHAIRPHHVYLQDGVATGVIHTGTPATIGDIRLLAGDREITVTAHIPGIGSATDDFVVGMPIATDSEFVLELAHIQQCLEERDMFPSGSYSQQCTETWQRLLVASHFFDVRAADDGRSLDTAQDTIDFLNAAFGGDNTESGNALFELVSALNDYSISDTPAAAMSDTLVDLLGRYLDTSEIDVDVDASTTADSYTVVAEMLKRMPEEPAPNELIVEAFPGRPGVSNVVISAMYSDGAIRIPAYMVDGTITLSSGAGLSHPAEIPTFGSTARQEAPGTRPSAAVVPVHIRGGGELTASLGGVGSASANINDIYPELSRELHVSPLPGSGERDIIAILSVLEGGVVVQHNGPIHIAPGQGASDVELEDWRGGAGIIRGSVDSVGEIIIHAPNVGAGTALTTPIRYETDLDVWYPDIVHVAEEFPLIAHTLDTGGMPVRKVDVQLAGDVAVVGNTIELTASGEVPIIIQYGSIFKSGIIDGFLNTADIFIRQSSGLVELDDTIVLHVDTGAMASPAVSISGGALTFDGEYERWEAAASTAGTHTVEVSVTQPGWEPYNEVVEFRVSHLLELDYDAVTEQGVRADAILTVCGREILPASFAQIEPGLCEVSVPEDMVVQGVRHKLSTLLVNDDIIQSGTTVHFDDDTRIVATYVGEITVEVTGELPDMSRELYYATYRPGDRVSFAVEPEYMWWGLVWDRPVQFIGMPSNAQYADNVMQWTAQSDVYGTITYERDYTYLIMLGAGGLAIPIVFTFRKRIPGLRFK